MKPVITIGFIPLLDAASLLIAADKGFAAREGIELTLVREVSWSNIRDRLAIGHYDAAHLLAPMAIAATLGLSHVRTPLVAAMNLAANGNAITVSPALHARLRNAAEGDLADPGVSARALGKIIREGEKRGAEPLTFGMTFPFSTHNYQLRYWMAEGGVDPDRDLRLVVVPPPYMVETIARGQVDGFCVGAPWNAVAADAGVGVVLHPGCAIIHPAPEKTLALRAEFAERDPQLIEALIRACLAAADFVKAPENRAEVAGLLARPDRVGVDAEILRHTLEGRLSAAAGTVPDYLIFGDRRTGRPDAAQAAWLYAQLRRWDQTGPSPERWAQARRVFDPRFFDAATGAAATPAAPITEFAGPICDADDVEAYVANFRTR